ncbi:MAG: 4Fe-4S dicluster domain-containing protein [Betaproteobacteria bacterium]|nr:4Fe-4S dicluster domain-containing protein [Betaproteobacteria bacterium]
MYAIPTIAYIILTVLLLAAMATLIVGLRRVGARIGVGSTPMSGPINRETLIKRGLLLSRLIKRPASGIAHLLLFFGALIEIGGHAVYVLSFVGIQVYRGWFGFLVMELGREVAGLMMLAGATFMFLRRLAPPKRLIAVKARPGFTAMNGLLLAIIVCGFLAEGFRLSDPAAASRGEFLGIAVAAVINSVMPTAAVLGNQLAWWLHGLLALVFIALIAYTPMSHIVLGPLNSALAPRRSGITLSAIDFEAELPEGEGLRLGAAKLSDLSQKSLLDLSACLWCGRCHEACPAAQTGKPLSPKKVMLTCAEYLAQGREHDAGLIDQLGMVAIFNCTSCAACVEVCPVSNNPAEVILEFRRHFVMDRSEMPDTMAAANKNLETRGHPFFGTATNPDDWRQGLDVPLFDAGKTEYLLWIGCSVIYEEQAQHAARAMVRLLEAARVSYGILDGPHCTGDPAKMMGNEMQFVDMAKANIEEFRELKVRKVITVCAHCFNSFDRYYPQLGGDWETIPHAVFIDRMVREGKLRPKASQRKITFHDPCYLARHNDIVEPGRSVVSSLGQLVEMPRSGKDSFCCGAGGGNYWGGQGGSARISDVRIEEALATGAERVATACSFCLLTLDSSASKHSEERKVFDIAELMVEAIEIR